MTCQQSRSRSSCPNYIQFYSPAQIQDICITRTVECKTQESLFANVDTDPPTLWLGGWTEGEQWGRLLCSGVLGKGQCTQLRSRGKCKTNMPHTCFPLSCHGSAFKDSPLLITHTHRTAPLPLLISTLSTGPRAAAPPHPRVQPRKAF